MHKARAKYDCDDSAGYQGYPPEETAMCGNWRRECERLCPSRD
jgi:hypothetical protein